MADKKTYVGMILCAFAFFWVWFAGVFYAHNETITNPHDHAGHASCYSAGPCKLCDQEQIKSSAACHSTGWRQAVSCADEHLSGGGRNDLADQKVHEWAYGMEDGGTAAGVSAAKADDDDLFNDTHTHADGITHAHAHVGTHTHADAAVKELPEATEFRSCGEEEIAAQRRKFISFMLLNVVIFVVGCAVTRRRKRLQQTK